MRLPAENMDAVNRGTGRYAVRIVIDGQTAKQNCGIGLNLKERRAEITVSGKRLGLGLAISAMRISCRCRGLAPEAYPLPRESKAADAVIIGGSEIDGDCFLGQNRNSSGQTGEFNVGRGILLWHNVNIKWTGPGETEIVAPREI